jgi:hypothetical protein
VAAILPQARGRAPSRVKSARWRPPGNRSGAGPWSVKMPTHTSATASIRVSPLDAEAVTQAAAHAQADIMPLSPHSDSTIVPNATAAP